jgi:hypothetical protein
MPLSILKLEKLLAEKGFIPSKYFIMNSLVVYMEILSVRDAETFLLYIPSKYKFTVGKATNVFKINYVDIEESENNTVVDYAGEPDEHDIENQYGKVDIGVSPSHDIETHLTANYKRNIKLKNMSRDDSKLSRDIFRQLKRLRLCVQNVKYKIAILYKNMLCAIKRDDSIEFYNIKKYRGNNSQKLYITVDLELLFEKMDSLMINIKTIRKEIYHILDKNQFTHTRTLQKLIEGKNTIKTFSNNACKSKIEHNKHLEESYDLLETINKSEKNQINKLYELNHKYNSEQKTSLASDIEKSHGKAIIEEDLKNIQTIKKNLVKTIFELKTKRETEMLIVDRIMFDNSVMIDCVLKNFEKLDMLCYNK